MNRRSVANLNTLIYLVINVRALQRAQSINRGLLQISSLHPSTNLSTSLLILCNLVPCFPGMSSGEPRKQARSIAEEHLLPLLFVHYRRFCQQERE